MTSTTATTISVIKKQALKLRVVRRKHAPEVARLCKIITDAAKEMVAVEAQIAKESAAIAGPDYEVNHTVAFQPFNDTIIAQVHDNGELLGLPLRRSSPTCRPSATPPATKRPRRKRRPARRFRARNRGSSSSSSSSSSVVVVAWWYYYYYHYYH